MAAVKKRTWTILPDESCSLLQRTLRIVRFLLQTKKNSSLKKKHNLKIFFFATFLVTKINCAINAYVYTIQATTIVNLVTL